MSYNNYYRTIVRNEFLGISKEISAPSRYELDIKVENQKRIWNERVQRELAKQNKEQMKLKAEQLTKSDKRKIEEYDNIIHIKKDHNCDLRLSTNPNSNASFELGFVFFCSSFSKILILFRLDMVFSMSSLPFSLSSWQQK